MQFSERNGRIMMVRRGTVAQGTALQVGKWRVPFPMGSLRLFTDLMSTSNIACGVQAADKDS
jgi:hypothetical protein